ncbi:MAG: beta-1,6-glucan synthase [Thauera phenolivorans]|uniref:Endo-1,3-beta-glucanase btgC n=1 Tax=Thauera phenolivorans TaxID=1792543 RepID=A0A7X7LU87_9RHOO|nr:beta-1,6-glucan synthase [Thauera phenolivorans]NLF53334.1 beta-1,6-glucan synthase [Thauera phenolivorans]
MPAPRPLPRTPWRVLLLSQLALLAGLLVWLGLQTRPQTMHDLHLAEGEKLHCVSYAPFHRPGQTPFDPAMRIGLEQVHEDLAALAKITDCVRLYSIDQGLEQVPAVARELGIGVLLGAWIGYDREKNALELERAIELANANADVVQALIVGNEVLLRRERTEDELRALIAHAQARTEVPVTYADVWEFWIRHDTLAAEVDFVTVHILPFWEDEPVDIEVALAHVARIRAEVGEHFDGKRILIGETGWPSAGRQREDSRPSRVNQARYIREFVHQAHARGWHYNLIEAIDQPWKRALEGTVGGFWGMLDAHTLAPKFPLAGPVAERESLAAPLAGAVVGGLAALLLAVGVRTSARRLRAAAVAASGALVGLTAALHFEHALLAYRNLLEWSVLGGVALITALLPLAIARWDGVPPGTAAAAWQRLRHAPEGLRAHEWLALARGLLLFAAAVAALLLFVDPRYRDFPTLLYLAPAAVFGVIGWFGAGAGRAERICAGVLALAVLGRWLPEPMNPQALAWLLAGLAFALPVLLRRPREHQQR